MLNEVIVESALNICPGDMVQSDYQWWRVTEHSVNLCDPAGVKMQLRSRLDNMLMALASSPFQKFNTIRAADFAVDCWFCGGVSMETCRCHNHPPGMRARPCSMFCNS